LFMASSSGPKTSSASGVRDRTAVDDLMAITERVLKGVVNALIDGAQMRVARAIARKEMVFVIVFNKFGNFF